METAEFAIAGTLIVLNTMFGFFEVLQAARSGHRFEYVKSPWNIVDCLCILLVYCYIFLVIMRGGAGSGLVPLAVFATLFLTMKLLAYLRGFPDTGKSFVYCRFYPSLGKILTYITSLASLSKKDGWSRC